MKKIYVLAIMLICSIVAFSQVKKVAILEIVDKEGKISYSQKLMLRSSLAKAVTNTAGYEAYDRTDMDAIMGEQDFQRTGMVSDDQIKRLGEMTGAAYILVAEAVKTDESSLFVTAKILDVETARTEQTDYTTMGIGSKTILQGCEELAAKLLKVNNTISINTATVSPSNSIYEEGGSLRQKGTKIYHNGILLNKRQYQNLLKNTCPKAFEQYKKGKVLTNVGWSFFALGPVLLMPVGIPILISGEPEVIGGTIMGIGGALFATSIPMICSGYKKRNKQAIEIFNNNCESTVTYNITAGQNGLGLAINF